jgi:hypothetical protein
MRDNRTYGFSKADADDLIAGIGSGESTFPERRPGSTQRGNFLLLTTSTITARSGTTLGSGTCDIYSRSGATISNTSVSITAYNSTLGTIASGRVVQAKLWQGVPLIDVEDCEES